MLTATGSGPSAPRARPVKLACRNLWKVFGANAAGFLAARASQPSAEDLAEAQLVGAVRDASLTVQEGEIFIIMGLSGSGKSTLLRPTSTTTASWPAARRARSCGAFSSRRRGPC